MVMEHLIHKDVKRNEIVMRMVNVLFWPHENEKPQRRNELLDLVWENPSIAEQVTLIYAKMLLGEKDRFDANKEAEILRLLKDIRETAREARTSRLRDRKEAALARKLAEKAGTRANLTLH